MDLNKIADKIPVIDDKVKYWLIRTEGGRYFDTFFDNNRIGFGSNFIEPKTILKWTKDKLEFNKNIMPIIEENYDTKIPSLMANSFYRFYYELKRDDIVLVPGVSSQQIRIASIIDDKPERFEFVDEGKNILCPHIHARKVKWLAIRDKLNFNPNFIKLFFAHQAIVDAEEYSDFINAVLYDIYVKKGVGHLLLNIRTKKAIKAKTLFNLFSELFDLSDEYMTSNLDLDPSSADIQTRTNLNSEGTVELITANLPYLVLIGTIVITLAGGGIKVPGLEFKSPGLLKPLLDFFKNRAERKERANLMRQALQELDMKQPQEILDLIESAGKSSEPEK